ncbi:MAG: hypothetical protein GPJ54_03695 [Candidatus Heimdallarchaeota archaeon]|nr:hypothetical protein [Candidatus Heimdallarchaeota archaeon]
MGADSAFLLSNEILDFHIKILERIFLQEPFDQIRKNNLKKLTELNYLAIIKKSGHLSFNDENKLIGAYPVSPSHTDYKINLEGIGIGYSMCAIDALGLPYTFKKKATITTFDKSTGDEISIEIDPKLELQKIHNLFVSYQNTPKDLQGNNSAANIQCPTIHFYSDKNDILETLQVWGYEKAIDYSKMRFGKNEMLRRIQVAIDNLYV